MEPITVREEARQAVAEQCDLCKQERISVREGDTFICEVCLDQEATGLFTPLP